MSDILNVNSDIVYNNSITRIEIHTHQPYVATTFNNSDEIRIPIQQQDIFTLPCESFLYIEGKLGQVNGSKPPTDTKIVNNGFVHMFDEIRYYLNGVEIEKNKSVGTCSTLKSYISFNKNESIALENAGWGFDTKLLDKEGNFNVCIPLKIILGFAEDYNKIILNLKQELLLIRSRNDNNIYTSSKELRVILHKIHWKVPHIFVGDREKLQLYKFIESGKNISMAYRSWDLYEYPLLPAAKKHTWAVKTSTQLEKPRYVIIGFQTDRRNKIDKDISIFDHCNLTNIKVYLNSMCYPYENLNLDFNTNQIAILYDMYTKFQKSYYERENSPLLSREEFKTIAPIAIIDLVNQNDTIKNGIVDVRIEFESKSAFPPQTTAQCLILHDRVVEYNPMSGLVKQIV